MIKTVLVSSLALLLLQFGYAQEVKPDAELEGITLRMRREMARNHILNLKDGVLLIRLSTKSKALETIRFNGYTQKANQMEADQKDMIKAIAEYFSKRIIFCEVAFFYSEDSRKLLQKDFDTIQFMDGQLNEIPNPLVNEANYLVLDLAILKANPRRFDLYRQESTDKGLENKPMYYASSNLHLPAFVLKDQSLVQLMDPFPYYVRAYSLEPSKFRIRIAARKLDKRLFRYYRNIK